MRQSSTVLSGARNAEGRNRLTSNRRRSDSDSVRSRSIIGDYESKTKTYRVPLMTSGIFSFFLSLSWIYFKQILPVSIQCRVDRLKTLPYSFFLAMHSINEAYRRRERESERKLFVLINIDSERVECCRANY